MPVTYDEQRRMHGFVAALASAPREPGKHQAEYERRRDGRQIRLTCLECDFVSQGTDPQTVCEAWNAHLPEGER